MLCAQCTEDLAEGVSSCTACGENPLLESAYRLETVVGHGAHGTTYRATRIADREIVAIKELLVRKVESLKAIELFERETDVLEQLDHPGIPAYLDELTVDAGRSVALYLVQEFVDGETLAAEFEDRRATPEEVFGIAAELLDTLSYMHGLSPPVIHRDIKPGNVMRNDEGRLVLIDFGAVRDAVDTAEGGSTVAGTFGYMAPEQFMGRAIPATDIYGVGATIVALLSRQDPQSLVGPDRTIEWEGRLGLEPPFEWVLGRMLDPNPSSRASDAAELARDIRAALRGELQRSHQPVSAAPQEVDLAVELPAATLAAVPPAPRELPVRFNKTYATGAKFAIPFGAAFGAAGVLAFVIAVGSAISDGTVVPAFFGVFFLLVFGGVGFGMLRSGLKKLAAAKRAYQHGKPAGAMIVDIGKSSYAVNDKHADVYEYEYVVDGKVWQGTFDTWDSLDLRPGDEVAIMYDEGVPSTSLLWDPAQYKVSRLARKKQQREPARAAREVELSFPDDEAAVQPEREEQAASGGDWA